MFGWRNKQTPEANATPAAPDPVRFGPYELGEQIGRGGAGFVFVAKHIGTGETVAIKTLRQHAAHDEQFDRRFLREMAILQKINHPHLLKYLDCGIDERGAYIVTEYIPRGTLSHVLQKHSMLPGSTVLQYATQLARALDYLHTQAIVHRDIKPANIFLTNDNQIKLGDFGLALDSTKASLTVSGMTVGSVMYMSPEQIRGSKATSSSDLYSLGCVIYEMLYGVPPFKSSNPYGIMEMHLESDLRFPDERLVRKDASTDEARTLIQELMQKSPESRPESARKVYERLTKLRPETTGETP